MIAEKMVVEWINVMEKSATLMSDKIDVVDCVKLQSNLVVA